MATPRLTDPEFALTVVLVVTHTGTDGAFGLVLNRPTEERSSDYLPEWREHLLDPAVVHYGGPVEPEIAIGLQVVGIQAELVDLSHPPGEDQAPVRVFAGYSGWDSGQLEGEIAAGYWVVAACLPGDTELAPESLREVVLRRQGGRIGVLASFTPTPELN